MSNTIINKPPAVKTGSGNIFRLMLVMIMAVAGMAVARPAQTGGSDAVISDSIRLSQHRKSVLIDTDRFTAGKLVGLTVVVDFPDQKAIHSLEQVNDLLNRKGGIEGSGAPMSVYDYFFEASNGRLKYTNIVVPVIITLPRNKSYYDNAEKPFAVASRELIEDVVKILNDQKISTRGITVETFRKQKAVAAFNIYFAGNSEHENFLMGLTSSGGICFNDGFTLNGLRINRYATVAMGTDKDLSWGISTFVHENGHALFRWPDLYYYANTAGLNFVGRWCIMGFSRLTHQPNPYFRYLAGWITPTDITNAPAGTLLSIKANSGEAYVYWRNAKEGYFIEARRRENPINNIPAGGLAIWHIHSDGDNTKYGGGGNVFPLARLMQANGRNDLGIEHGHETDLFRAGVKTKFNSKTIPAAVWHDGTPSGFSISRISDTGAVMSFKIGDDNYVDEMLPKYEFYHQIMDYAKAGDNVEIAADKDFTLGTLIKITKPAKAGATLTIRSKNPVAPITLTRGISGDLFTVNDGATLILENIIIDGDKGSFADGGGMLVTVNKGGTLIMNDGAVLRNNAVKNNGGGVWVHNGAFTMNGGEISGNTAGGSGGGVYVWSGALTMAGGKITGNTAIKNGGGVFITESEFAMTGGEISNNTAGTSGGGAYVWNKGTLTMTGGKIGGNTAKSGSNKEVHVLDGTFNRNSGAVD